LLVVSQYIKLVYTLQVFLLLNCEFYLFINYISTLQWNEVMQLALCFHVIYPAICDISTISVVHICSIVILDFQQTCQLSNKN